MKTLYEKFEELMAHLNSEENELALEFRKELEDYIEDAEDSQAWLDALEGAGVDNWEGCEYAIEAYREWKGGGC